MRSFPPEAENALQTKLTLLDRLAASYAAALTSFLDHDLDGASEHVAAADPILESLARNEGALQRFGVEAPAEIQTRAADVRALHRRLLGVIEEEHAEVRQERGRLATARRSVRGYAGRGDPTGGRIDGQA